MLSINVKKYDKKYFICKDTFSYSSVKTSNLDTKYEESFGWIEEFNKFVSRQYKVEYSWVL